VCKLWCLLHLSDYILLKVVVTLRFAVLMVRMLETGCLSQIILLQVRHSKW